MSAAVKWLDEQFELAASARAKLRTDNNRGRFTPAEHEAFERWPGSAVNCSMFSIKTDMNEKPMRWHPCTWPSREEPGPDDWRPCP